MLPAYYFVFDVESIGLHGEPYAVGWVVMDQDWNEVESGCMSVEPGLVHGDTDDREWCEKNIPAIDITHLGLRSLLVDFWSTWLTWKASGAIMFAECAWPVEAKFLTMCLHTDYPNSKWDGPYPMHDVASVMLAKGMDPMATYDRLPSEQPKHDPVADARQSARLLKTAFNQ